MKTRKLLSAVLCAALLAPIFPASMTVAGEETTEDFSFEEVSGDITFTEYNDKENEQYKIVGKNRRGAHTDAAVPYENEEKALNSALNYAKETSGRVKMLTGDEAANTWDFTVVKNLKAAKASELQRPKEVSQLPYLELAVDAASSPTPTVESTPTASPETSENVWDTFEDEFTGETSDYGIVWYKYSGDSDNGTYSVAEDDSLTITVGNENGKTPCYGVSAVIKNIQPNTKYTISFKEKTSITDITNTGHGFYLNTDTLLMTQSNTNPNTIGVAQTRNNKKLATLHNAVYPIEVSVVASNLGKWEKVSGAAAETTFLINSAQPSIGGTVENGVLTSVYAKNIDTQAVMYAAQYDENGALTDVDTVEFDASGEKSVNIPVLEDVVLMLWDKEQKPLCSAVTVR